MKTKWLALLAVFCFVLTLMPVTAVAAEVEAPAAVSQEPSALADGEQDGDLFEQVPEELNGTKITMQVWWSIGASDKQKATEFKEKTGISVAFTTAPFYYYQSDLASKIMSGNPPATAAIINEWHLQPIVGGLMQPIENTGWDFTDPIYATNLMDQFAIDGKRYGIALKGSIMSNFEVMFFNKTMLAKNGVEKDPYELWKEGNWNWDTCLEIAQKCTDHKKNQYGLTLISQYYWMLSAGQDFVSYDGNDLQNNIRSSELLNAWNHAWDMINTHKVIPTIFSQQQQLFFSGMVAMMGGGSCFMQADPGYPYVPQNCKFEWGVVPFPSPKGQDPVSACEASVWGFPTQVKGDRLQAAAWWLRYYLDDAHYTDRDLYANEQCWEVSDAMWNQEIQSLNSTGTISCGTNYSAWSIQYSLIDEAATREAVATNLESWYDKVETQIRKINWMKDEYVGATHICVYTDAFDVECNVCGEVRTLQYIEENTDTTVTFNKPHQIAEMLFVPEETGEYFFYGDGFNDAEGAVLDTDYAVLQESERELDKDFILSYTLTAGETYVLRVNNTGFDSGEVSVRIKRAETEDWFTYTIEDGAVTITGCLSSYTGEMAIPSTIEGLPVTVIGEDAFNWCRWITTVTIPDSVTTIETDAFCACYSLREVLIGRGVQAIADDAFELCNRMTRFVVDAQNACYSSAGGVLFNKDMSVLLLCPNAKEGEYTVPDGVATIADGAFEYCIGLTAVVIPDCVTEIGDYAFRYCEELLSVTLGAGITRIPQEAFSWCFELKEIVIPIGVTVVERYAFEGCDTQSSVTIGKSYQDGAEMYGSLTDIHYGGSEEDAARMAIEEGNPALATATWHYNYAPVCDHVYDDDADPDCNACGVLRWAVCPDTDVTIRYEDGSVLPAGTTITVDAVEIDDSDVDLDEQTTLVVVYDISMLLNGQEIQPDGVVAVTLPAPADIDRYTDLQVVYIDDAGNVTPCETVVNPDGTITFYTDHFSYYAIVGTPAVVYGDANGDGAVNNRDVALLQQYINKWEVVLDMTAADANGDGAVNNRDVALLQQYINKWDVELG